MSGRLSRFRVEFRQRGHHRAFRIPPAPDQDLQELLQVLAQVAEAPADDLPVNEPVEGGRSDGPVVAEPDNADEEKAEEGLDEKILADAVTNLWRAQRRLERAEKDKADHVRHPARFLRTCSALLNDAGLVVQDHDGNRFNPGQSLEVLAFQEEPSVAVETVVETIRPTIYLRGRRIQMGQVIVGHPPNAGTEHAESEELS